MSDNIRTLQQMRSAGYKFLNHHVCKGCGADIEWWETNNGKKIPFDPMPKFDHEETTPHWANCPNANDFRSEKKPSDRGTKPDLQQEINRLREATDARVIVAVLDNRRVAAWRKNLRAEDIRHELIIFANSIRNHIDGGK